MAQMRGPGIPFPLTSPQTANGAPAAIMLQPGGIFTVPQGEYLVIPGQQTVLEYFDSFSGQWRATQCYQGQVEQISADGGNYRLVNLSGVIVGASITNAGSGGTNGIGPVQTGSTVTFGASASGGATTNAQGYVIVGGSVPAPTIVNGGQGFVVPPIVCCDPPPAGGIQATFVATISAAGVITGVTQVNPGAGYTSIPQFYVIPQPQFSYQAPRYPGDAAALAVGSVINFPAAGLINQANTISGTIFQANINNVLGAQLTGNALTGSGTLTAIIMTYYGALYTGSQAGAITFGGTSLGAAAATPIFSFCLTGTSVTGAGTGYIVGAPAETTLGLVASQSNNNLFTPRAGRGIVTNANGTFTIEDPGFGIQKASAIGIGGGSITTLATVPAASLGGINDVSILQGMVQ